MVDNTLLYILQLIYKKSNFYIIYIKKIKKIIFFKKIIDIFKIKGIICVGDNMKKLLEKDRIKIIEDYLIEKTFLTYEEIVKITNSSLATARRDINKMYKSGMLNKVSCGVEAVKHIEDISYDIRKGENIEEKKKIAKKASKFIEENDFIFLDAGTTTYEIIKYLKDKNVCVVTNGIGNLKKLNEYGINTILLGGNLKKETNVIVGSIAVEQLSRYNFNKCFIGVNAYSDKKGFMTPSTEEAILKKIAIEKSIKRYVVADKSKKNKVASIKIAEYDECILITD